MNRKIVMFGIGLMAFLIAFNVLVSAADKYNSCVVDDGKWKCKSIEGLGPDECETDEDCEAKATALIYEKIKRADVQATLYGTEYVPGENGRIFLQLLSNFYPLNNASCFLTAYSPDNSILLNGVPMTYLPDSDGLYYEDLIIPDTLGVYMLSAYCTIPDTSYIQDFPNISVLYTYENTTITGGKLVLTNYPSTIYEYTYTDLEWDGFDTLNAPGEILGVDFDFGNISNIVLLRGCFHVKTQGVGGTAQGNLTINTTFTNAQIDIGGTYSCQCVEISGAELNYLQDGINRIGLGCDYCAPTADQIQLNYDNDPPIDGTSYAYKPPPPAWVNLPAYDLGVCVNITRVHEHFGFASLYVNASEDFKSWNMFYADYALPGDTAIQFNITDLANNTLCSFTAPSYDIESCAGNESEIFIWIYMRSNNSNSPQLDKLWLTYNRAYFQEIRGSGELHISDRISNSSIETITEKVWKYFYKLGTPPLLPSTTYSCFDDDVLIKNITYEFCDDEVCEDLSRAEREFCDYGCKSNACQPNPAEMTLLIFGVIIFVSLLLVFIAWLSRRRGID